MPQGDAREDQKEEQRAAMIRRFLQYPTRYKCKEEFMEFCVKKIVFTGRNEDLVLRKDFNDELEAHTGVSFATNKDIGKHLVSAGVRIIRITRHYVREYCYSGLRLADGEGRRFADFMKPAGTSSATEVGVAATLEEEKGTAAQRHPLANEASSSCLQAPSEGSQVKASRKRRPLAARTTPSYLLDSSSASSSHQAPKEGKQVIKISPKFLPVTPKTTSSPPQLPDGTIHPSEGKEDNTTTLQKLLNYRTQYRDKDAFIRFCQDKLRFTSDPTDIVFRKDLNHEFVKFLGGNIHSPTTVGMHLGSAGVKVSRLGAKHNKEYCYRGMHFADGRGRKLATVGRSRTNWRHRSRKQKGKQTGEAKTRWLNDASLKQTRDPGVSTSTLNSLLNQPRPASTSCPAAVPGSSSTLAYHPVPALSPVPGPSSAADIPASTPNPAPTPAPAALDLRTSSALPLNLTLSTPTHTHPTNQSQYLPAHPNPHLPPTPSSATHTILPFPPPAHSKIEAPTLTLPQVQVDFAQLAQPSNPSGNSPQAALHLVLSLPAYVTWPKT